MKNIPSKSILIFLASFALLFSCRFSSDEYYFVELNKPKEPELEIVELSLDQDTIVLAEFQEVKFNFNAGQYKVTDVSILIDGEEKYTSPNYQGSFTLLTNDISEGVHKLSFSVITNSNSGSIADLLGAEGYQFISNEWTLICIKNDRLASYATTEIENGKLKLSWEPHEKINFKRYRITKSRNYYSGPIKEYYTTEPFFIDEAYVGEKAHYDIFAEYYSTDFYLQWAELEVANTLPEIKIRLTNNNQFEAYWEDNDFTAATKHYRLIQLPTPSDTITLAEIPPGEENSYIIPNGIFASEINYKLVVVPKYPENPFNNEELYYHSKSFEGLLGDKSFEYQQISSIRDNELLVLTDGIIYRYSKTLSKNTDSLTYNPDNCHVGYSGFSVSPNGTYFTTHESCNSNLVLMNPANLKNYQSHPVNHVVPQGMRFYSMPVSDNGIVVAKDYGQVSVYDVLNNRLIDYYEENSSIGNMGISLDGNYFYVQTSELIFYTIKEDTIAKVWNSPPAYNYIYSDYAYDPQDSKVIILYDGETLYHKNTADFGTIKSVTLGEDMILNFDFPSRKLLAYSENYLSVYSIDSGELLNRIKAHPRVMLSQQQCTLALNTIFLNDGVCINLPNN